MKGFLMRYLLLLSLFFMKNTSCSVKHKNGLSTPRTNIYTLFELKRLEEKHQKYCVQVAAQLKKEQKRTSVASKSVRFDQEFTECTITRPSYKKNNKKVESYHRKLSSQASPRTMRSDNNKVFGVIIPQESELK